MKNTAALKAVCTLLCLALAITAIPFSAQAAEKASKAPFVSRLCFDIDDDESVRAIILYDGDSAVDMVQKGTAASTKAASKTVISRQKALTAKICNAGASLAFSYGTLLNGVAVDASYGALKDIEKMEGVKSVYLANAYSAPVVSASPSTASVTEAYGQVPGKGSGAVIAVLDTSFNTSHEAFSVYRVSETLTKAKMEAIRDSARGLNGHGVYVNAKIPFAYDYASKDTVVANHISHGTAVAGIAAGNSGTYEGIAPYAQILAMKIFDDSTVQTDSSIYFAALEDAFLLGADVINMSLGAQNGFAFDYELETEVYGSIYETLKNEGVFVFAAVGNEYSQGHGSFAYNHASKTTGVNAVSKDYADYGVAGSPASYNDVIAVGSFENTKRYAYTVTIDGKSIPYKDNAECMADSFWPKFSDATHDFVMIPGNGAAEDYAGVSASGKIAVAKHGTVSYQDMVYAAANAGAKALIIINDDNNDVLMGIQNYAVPAVLVLNKYADEFENNTSGRITVDLSQKLVEDTTALQPSGYSSWGCTPELTLKPQISAIGSSVLCPESTYTYSYQISSGTSMATPVVSGYVAALKMLYKKLGSSPYSGFSNKQMYDFIYSVITSSALYNDLVSPRKQGAGLVNSTNLSPAYFTNPIVNLKNDKNKSGTFSFTVSAACINEGATLSLSKATVLADKLIEHNGKEYNSLTSIAIDALVSVDAASYTLSQTPTEITVTISLSDSAKQYLDRFTNGAFVEGYIEFDVSGSEDDPHLTFMGFYGDWNAAPAFEVYDWGDIVDANYYLNTTLVEGTDKTYADSGYTYLDILDTNVGYNEAYLMNSKGEGIGILGDNMYDWVQYDEKRLAFSTANAACEHLAEGFLMYPSLLRNVRHIIMTVSNAETGKVYYVDDTEYAMKNYYDTGSNAFMPGTYFTWDGTYLDSDGTVRYVPNDTEIKVTFQTQLAYENAPLVTVREYIMYVDCEAPKVRYDWNATEKKLTVRAEDKQYISNIFVYNNDYELMYASDAVDSSEKNEEFVAVYDLSHVDFGSYTSFIVEVQDYATNYSSIEVPLSYDKGDVNKDGEVNNIDAAQILKYDAGIIELDTDALAIGDVNGDGDTNNLDAALILKYECGLLDSL